MNRRIIFLLIASVFVATPVTRAAAPRECPTPIELRYAGYILGRGEVRTNEIRETLSGGMGGYPRSPAVVGSGVWGFIGFRKPFIHGVYSGIVREIAQSSFDVLGMHLNSPGISEIRQHLLDIVSSIGGTSLDENSLEKLSPADLDRACDSLLEALREAKSLLPPD
jgi:hypothetical protein